MIGIDVVPHRTKGCSNLRSADRTVEVALFVGLRFDHGGGGVGHLTVELIGQGAVPKSSTPAELQKLIDADAARYGKIIRDKGVKID